jgi:hypothetical protein
VGFDVSMVVTLPTMPTSALLADLDHQFEVIDHAPGSKVVTVIEHVAVTNEPDAIAFVRALVLDAVPPGSKLSEITVTADP